MASDRSRPGALTTGRQTVVGVLWSLTGYLLPVVIGLFTMPLLIGALGAERFGLLAMVWMVVGYFSLFDLGLGRALTQRLATHLATHGSDQMADRLVWTATLTMVAIGVLAALLLLFAIPLIAGWVGHDHPLWIEAGETLFWVALVIPAVSATSGLRGALEGHHSFRVVNLLRLATGLINFVAPLVALIADQPLVAAIGALVAGRLLLTLFHLAALLTVQPGLTARLAWHRPLLPDLLSFGGWLTVSNLVSPLMVYMDRFVIGALLGLSAVAYYITPYEVLIRTLVIPAALTSVLLPVISARLATAPLQARAPFHAGMLLLALLLLPPLLLLAAHAEPLLAWWLDPRFATAGRVVVEWLTLGLWFNAIAQLPYTMLHSAGRADLAARLHLAELVIYLPLLWLAVDGWGIAGAAAVWTLRVAVDLTAMSRLAAGAEPEAATMPRWLPQLLLVATAGWFTTLQLEGALPRSLMVVVVVVLALLITRRELVTLIHQLPLPQQWRQRIND